MEVKEFHVTGTGNLTKLTKFELKIQEFICAQFSNLSLDEQKAKVGISISEKTLRKNLSDWNKEKMTVSASSLDLCAKTKKVCQGIAASIENNDSFAIIPTVKANDKQGTFYITFVNKSNISKEYTSKELGKETKNEKTKNYLDAILKILSKEDFKENIASDNDASDKITQILAALNQVK